MNILARLICLFNGHDYTTIAWQRKVWSEKACLRCDRRIHRGKGWTPPKPQPLRRVK